MSRAPDAASLASRPGIWLSMAYVAVVGAGASYIQALTVVQATDGRGAVSYFVAGLADPTIFAASANLYDAYRKGERLPRWSMLSIAVALVVTGGANGMAGHPSVVPAWLVRAWPPVAFLMALESLMSYVRRGRGVLAPEGVPAAPGHPEPVATEEALALLLASDSQRKLAEALGVPRSRVETWAARTAVAAHAGANGSSPDE